VAKWVNAPHFPNGGKAAIARDSLGLVQASGFFRKSGSAERLAIMNCL
jgi:hypothetical protein